MILNDRLPRSQMTMTLDIRYGSAHAAITNILWVRKLTTIWVQVMLTIEQKLNRLEYSRQILTRFSANLAALPNECLPRMKRGVSGYAGATEVYCKTQRRMCN